MHLQDSVLSIFQARPSSPPDPAVMYLGEDTSPVPGEDPQLERRAYSLLISNHERHIRRKYLAGAVHGYFKTWADPSAVMDRSPKRAACWSIFHMTCLWRFLAWLLRQENISLTWLLLQVHCKYQKKGLQYSHFWGIQCRPACSLHNIDFHNLLKQDKDDFGEFIQEFVDLMLANHS